METHYEYLHKPNHARYTGCGMDSIGGFGPVDIDMLAVVLFLGFGMIVFRDERLVSGCVVYV